MMDAAPVLVTGAAGFIGRRLAHDLRRSGVRVRVLLRPQHDGADLQAAGVEILRGDAADKAQMQRAAAGCGVVYHLAAARGPKKLSRAEYLRINSELVDAAAAAALGAGARLVVASTVRVLGGWPPRAAALGTPHRPTSNYGASRAENECRLVERWAPKGLDYRIARIAERVGGPGAKDWLRIACAVRDGRYRYLPRGGTVHSCDVDDVVAGLRLCAGETARPGETYVLIARSPESVEKVLAIMAERLGVRFAPAHFSGWPARIYKRLGDITYRAGRYELPHAFTAEFYAWPNHFDGAGTGERLGFAPRYTVWQAVERATLWMQGEGLV